jgi:hypothetical protein
MTVESRWSEGVPQLDLGGVRFANPGTPWAGSRRGLLWQNAWELRDSFQFNSNQ